MLSSKIQTLLEALPLDLDMAGERHVFKHLAQSLIADPQQAQVVVAAIGSCEDSANIDERLVTLLTSTLDEARMARENGKKTGAAFIDAMQGCVATFKGQGTLTDSGRLFLAACWVRAGLAAPDALEGELDMPGDMVSDLDLSDAPDLGPLINKLMQDVSGGQTESTSALHGGLSELIATVPAAVRKGVIQQVVACAKPVFGELGCALLLDGRSEIRRGALAGLSDRLEAGAITPDIIARLTVMRSWIPDDDTRLGIDAIVRKAMRNGSGGATSRLAPKIHRALSSLVDGTGAQSMSLAIQKGGTRSVAIVLIKQGFGIKDAYVVPCASASEQRRLIDMIASEVETREVPEGYVEEAIAIGLADGLEAGCPPAPGLVDVVQVLGLNELRPRPASVSGIGALADPEGRIAAMSAQVRGRLIGSSSDWQEHYPMIVESWYEDSDDLTDAINAARTPAAMRRALWQALEARRAHWAKIVMRMAHLLRAAGGDADADQFVAVAMALEAGRALKKIPVMEMIFDLSLQVWLHDRGNAGDFPAQGEATAFEMTSGPVPPGMKIPGIRPEKPGELDRLLQPAGLTQWWIDGYMMGVNTAPTFVPPGVWIQVLLNLIGPEIRSDETLQRILDLLMLRYNGALTQLRSPSGGALIPEDETLMSIWADGYLTAWEGNRDYWPGGKPGKADKVARKLLEDATSFCADAQSFHAVIPGWLQRNFTARS